MNLMKNIIRSRRIRLNSSTVKPNPLGGQAGVDHVVAFPGSIPTGLILMGLLL